MNGSGRAPNRVIQIQKSAIHETTRLSKEVDPGDEVILPSPTYSTHIQQVIIASGKPVLVPAIEKEGRIWPYAF